MSHVQVIGKLMILRERERENKCVLGEEATRDSLQPRTIRPPALGVTLGTASEAWVVPQGSYTSSGTRTGGTLGCARGRVGRVGVE